LSETKGVFEKYQVWIGIGLLALSIVGFNLKDAFRSNGQDAVLQEKVDELQKSVERIDTEKVNRDVLNLQLAAIQARIDELQRAESSLAERLDDILNRRR